MDDAVALAVMDTLGATPPTATEVHLHDELRAWYLPPGGTVLSWDDLVSIVSDLLTDMRARGWLIGEAINRYLDQQKDGHGGDGGLVAVCQRLAAQIGTSATSLFKCAQAARYFPEHARDLTLAPTVAYEFTVGASTPEEAQARLERAREEGWATARGVREAKALCKMGATGDWQAVELVYVDALGELWAEMPGQPAALLALFGVSDTDAPAYHAGKALVLKRLGVAVRQFRRGPGFDAGLYDRLVEELARRLWLEQETGLAGAWDAVAAGTREEFYRQAREQLKISR